MSDIKLCVNIDHVATLRQARGGIQPDPINAARIIQDAGADGITVHLREDRRHIQDDDVYSLKEIVAGKFNLEMALSKDIIAIAKKVIPHQITIVPERRAELTTEGGLNVEDYFDKIKNAVDDFHELGILVSLFILPDLEAVDLSKKTGADFIEIHTGTYCNAHDRNEFENELENIYLAAELALNLGLRVNAGHGLNYHNLKPILKIPGLEELNIGHSIISRSVFVGIENAVIEMIDIVRS
jgi:pyridoxine 5-phosphate synthase